MQADCRLKVCIHMLYIIAYGPYDGIIRISDSALTVFIQITKASISWFLFIGMTVYHLFFVMVVCYDYDSWIPKRFRKTETAENQRVQVLFEDLQMNVEKIKETLQSDGKINHKAEIDVKSQNDPLRIDDFKNFDLSFEPKIEQYPELNDMKRLIINGTFDWSKTAKSILFLKKHQCLDTLLRESLRIGATLFQILSDTVLVIYDSNTSLNV